MTAADVSDTLAMALRSSGLERTTYTCGARPFGPYSELDRRVKKEVPG
jgi:hypothetical protein